MRISERERMVKAPVKRCGRSALSIPGEGASCVVWTEAPVIGFMSAAIYAEFRWYRGIIIALKRIRFRAFPFL